jgi:hypothetical protein
MCKKFLVLALMFVLASTSYGVVIGDWGNGMDGWDATPWSQPFGVTNTDDTIGHTLGSGSLKVVGTGGWWTGRIGDKILTGDQIASIANHTTTNFQMDVTRFSSDWTSGWWIAKSRIMATVNLGLYNPTEDVWAYPAAIDSMLGGTWYPMYMDGRSDPGNGYPNPVVGGPDGVPVREVWSLQPVFDILNSYAGYELRGMDIALMIANDGYTGNVTYYLDNAQLTPEPATLALLGLGGLAMIRRKR